MLRNLRPLLAYLAPGLLWLWLFNHLQVEWTVNAQYNYGWGVPFLAALIGYLRWNDRPPAAAAQRGRWSGFVAIGLLGLLLPIRVVQEANPDWRLLSWVFALVVVGYSLLIITRTAGAASARHFAFPVCFPLVAVPWPAQAENVIIQGMTRAVAYTAVEIAGWLGVGAFRRGNVIELHNGFVGVDDACSGVKTLQAAIMVTLLLGELLRLRPAKRLLLVAIGCVWMFACNIARATSLVIIAARRSVEALHRWHDLVGTTGLIIGMAGVLALSWLIARRSSRAEPLSEHSALSATVAEQSWAGAVLWLLFVFAATELRYRSQERQLVGRPAWEAKWPNDTTQQKMPIADATRAILRYDRASSAAWKEPPRSVWWGFFARWEPRRAALQLVRSHSPEICLPAAGRTFVGELAPVTVETQLLPLTFRAFQFEQDRQPLFVFVCIQEDKIARGDLPRAGFSARSRMLAAWHGERNLGQRLLELAIIGAGDATTASDSLAATVRAIVAPATAEPTG